MIEKSPQIGTLAAALVKVQAGLQAAKKTSVNPFHKSQYADLAEVWSACREALGANGIAVVQFPGSDPMTGEVSVETMLIHTSGEFLSKAVSANPKDLLPQSVGSAITYLRRYGLASAIGVITEDDDGEGAQPRPQDRPATTKVQAAPTQPKPKSTPPPAPNTFPTKEDLPDTKPVAALPPREECIAQIKRLAWKLKFASNMETWTDFFAALVGATPEAASLNKVQQGQLAMEKADGDANIKAWAGQAWKVSSVSQSQALGLIVAFNLARTQDALLNITGSTPFTKDAKGVKTMCANLESFLTPESEGA